MCAGLGARLTRGLFHHPQPRESREPLRVSRFDCTYLVVRLSRLLAQLSCSSHGRRNVFANLVLRRAISPSLGSTEGRYEVGFLPNNNLSRGWDCGLVSHVSRDERTFGQQPSVLGTGRATTTYPLVALDMEAYPQGASCQLPFLPYPSPEAQALR